MRAGRRLRMILHAERRLRPVTDALDRLAGDCRVVDAIYAVNDVRRRVGTLKTED